PQADTQKPNQEFDDLPLNPVEENLPDFSKEKTVSIPPAQPIATPGSTAISTQKQSADPMPKGNPISINESDMLIKDMEGSVLEKMPLEDILSAETKADIFVDVKNQQEIKQTQAQKEQKIIEQVPQSQDTFNVFEHGLKEQTNVIDDDIKDVQDITERLTQKNMEFTKQPNKLQKPKQTPSTSKQETDAFVAEQKTIRPPAVSEQEVKTAANEVPFTLGSSQEGKKPLLSELSSETLPDEEVLESTVPPFPVAGEDESLPEITVRTDRDKLDKTFNLETTFNTELIKRQHEKNKALQEGRDMLQEPPHTKTILRLKKPSTPNAPESQAGKTILRLRRKTNTNAAVPPTLKSTMSPERAAENMRIAKQKNIDHSIQIPTSELKKHNWPLEVPLVPTYTLNNMVMSVNRFAHATAISVIESPGKLYNPLVLHGGTGTGKTHFLNALAYALSQKFGQEHIFMTNGVRLSRGIQRYVMEGNIDKFESFMNSVNALLIDDIHLLAINEQNRVFISKLLNTFIKQQKQIVITSKYPPESLEKLEELINFKLDSGWISELKPATGATHFRIVKKMLIENGVDLNDSQIENFFGRAHMTLGTVTRSI
ncbi:MAG: ATP-binding protein, partial [Elusimicrobiaceae bacterium]|nr:ATP-binding protein [Elusimicrobiaceae bacterium]